jgi:hypothetical protein
VSTSKYLTTDCYDSPPITCSISSWHIVGLDYLTHLHVSHGFDNVMIAVDHLSRMAHFLPCTKSVTTKEIANLFYRKSTVYTDYLECWTLIATRNSLVTFGIRFGDALERD